MPRRTLNATQPRRLGRVDAPSKVAVRRVRRLGGTRPTAIEGQGFIEKSVDLTATGQYVHHGRGWQVFGLGIERGDAVAGGSVVVRRGTAEPITEQAVVDERGRVIFENVVKPE